METQTSLFPLTLKALASFYVRHRNFISLSDALDTAKTFESCLGRLPKETEKLLKTKGVRPDSVAFIDVLRTYWHEVSRDG